MKWYSKPFKTSRVWFLFLGLFLVYCILAHVTAISHVKLLKRTSTGGSSFRGFISMALEKGAFSQHSKGFWALLLHNKKDQWHTQDSAHVGQQFPHRFMWKLDRLRENMLEGSHACLHVEYRVFHSQKKYSSNLLLQVLLNVIHNEEEQNSCTNTT